MADYIVTGPSGKSYKVSRPDSAASPTAAPASPSFFDRPDVTATMRGGGAMLGGVAGTALGAAAGGIGAVPGGLTGAATGAGGAEALRNLLARFTGGGPKTNTEAIMGPVNQAATGMALQAAPELAGMAGQAIGQGAKGVVSAGGKVVDFLKGNPVKIQQAEQLARHGMDEIVTSLRAGGKAHGALKAGLQAEADTAWAPMEQLAQSIPGRISPDSLMVRGYQTLEQTEPQLWQQVRPIVEELAKKAPKVGGNTGWSAQELIDEMTALGQQLRQAAAAGKVPKDAPEAVITATRSLIADELQSRAPQQLQEAVHQAWQGWKAYRTYLDKTHQLFGIGKDAARGDTKAGVNFLSKAFQIGDKSLAPDDLRYLQWIEQKLGGSLQPLLKSALMKVGKAKQLGRFGQAVTTSAKLASPVAAGGLILKALSRR